MLKGGLLNIVVWNEFVQERQVGVPGELYPDGIHAVIGDGLRAAGQTGRGRATEV